MKALFAGSRLECHAFLDGLLPEPDQDYSRASREVSAAYQAGLALRGHHPGAECRAESEPGTGQILHSVWPESSRPD